MGYVALYRKWRPMTFEDVVEQSAVVSILKNAVMSGRIAHAYLFCGTRGTGKTTLAKIFARAVNCEHPVDGNPCNECAICKGILNQQILDVSEIDAASNNGVDNIRAIIDETAYASSVAKYRVYIIDEVHMLSVGAFNALLKTLEEPPADVIFILATTEPHKLPVTILSRCQRYDFKRISQEGIIGRLQKICDASQVHCSPEALGFLAQKADGAMRDAISLLDQTIASCGTEITLAGARSATGSLDKAFLEDFAQALLEANGAGMLQMTHRLFTDGRDPSNFIGELMQVYRNMLVILTVRNPAKFLYEDEAGLARLQKLCELTSVSELALFIQALSRLDNNLKWAVQRKILFEAGMLELCNRKWSTDDAELTARLAALENRVSDLVAKGIRLTGTPAVVNAAAPETTPETAPESAPEALPDTAAPQAAPQAVTNTAKPEKKQAASAQRSVDPADWRDFLSNLNDKRMASVASLFNMGCKGYWVSANTVAAVFHSKMMKEMVSKQNCGETLDTCASSAFGRSVHLSLMLEEEFASYVPETPENETPAAEPADSFEASCAKLQKLSEKHGFEIQEITQE